MMTGDHPISVVTHGVGLWTVLIAQAALDGRECHVSGAARAKTATRGWIGGIGRLALQGDAAAASF